MRIESSIKTTTQASPRTKDSLAGPSRQKTFRILCDRNKNMRTYGAAYTIAREVWLNISCSQAHWFYPAAILHLRLVEWSGPAVSDWSSSRSFEWRHVVLRWNCQCFLRSWCGVTFGRERRGWRWTWRFRRCSVACSSSPVAVTTSYKLHCLIVTLMLYTNWDIRRLY